jgi:hypothetical protein
MKTLCKALLSGVAILSLASVPAAAESGTSGGNGTSMSAPAQGANSKGALGSEAGEDSNTSSHKGATDVNAKSIPAGTVTGATGDVGSAKKNKKQHGSADSGKTPDAVQNSAKQGASPAAH